MNQLDKLRDLGKHIAALDSGSGDAAAILWGVAEIERLRAFIQTLDQRYICIRSDDGFVDDGFIVAADILEQGGQGNG